MILGAVISIAATTTLLAAEPQLPSPTYNLTVTGATQLPGIEVPFPPIDGEFPVRQTTFLGPGAPFRVWAGARVRF